MAHRRSVPQALQSGCLYAPFQLGRSSVCASWAFAPDGADVQATFDQDCTVASLLGLLAARGCAWAAQTTDAAAWRLLHRGPGRRPKLIRGDVRVLDIPGGVWTHVAIASDGAGDLLPGAVTPGDTSYFRPYHTR